MADQTESTNQTPDDLASLETLESPQNTPGNPEQSLPTAEPRPPQDKRLRRLRQRLNIYLLIFGFVILVAAGVILAAYLQNHHSSLTGQLQTQGLSQSTLQQLANSDATVGSNQTILNVESSAVFAGQVLVRQSLEVAGNLQVGGTVALNNITVAGTGQFGQASVSGNLAVTGNTAIQGAETISKSLQVSGTGSFGGALSAPQITTASLQLSGDLVLTHHITIGGSTPSRSNGPALGSGGTASVSGSDTAGSISINTGTGPAAGCFVTITFSSAFAATPHVLVTPIGSAAAGLAYYVNRSTTGFSVCTGTAAPASSSFGFDYLVIG